MNHEEIRVLHLPHYQSNPYQTQLISGLEEQENLKAKVTRGYPRDILVSLFVFRPNIIHFHWVSKYLISSNLAITLAKSFVFLLFCSVLRLVGVRLVWTGHNLNNHESIYTKYEMIAKSIFTSIMDVTIAHCDSAAKDFSDQLGINRNNIRVVPHGHFIDSYVDTVSPTESRKILGIPESKTVYTFFGQIRQYKQVPELIEAFRAQDPEDSILFIVGNPANSDLQSLIVNRCSDTSTIRTDLRYIPDSEVQIYMKASDFIVLPFANIITSGSVILAMSFGKAVITPKKGCISELLSNQDELLLDENGNIVKNIADKLSVATEMGSDKIGKMNRKKIQAFTWENVASKTTLIYEELTK